MSSTGFCVGWMPEAPSSIVLGDLPDGVLGGRRVELRLMALGPADQQRLVVPEIPGVGQHRSGSCFQISTWWASRPTSRQAAQMTSLRMTP